MCERRTVQAGAQTESRCRKPRSRRVRGFLRERERDDRRVFCGRGAVDDRTAYPVQSGDELFAECRLMPEHPVCALPHDPLHPGVERGNARHIDRSRFERIRQIFRHLQRGRQRAGAALHQRPERNGAVRQQHPRAHDAVQPLVPRRTEQVNAVLHRDRQDAAALCAVRNEDQPVRFAECSDLPVRQDLPGDIADQRADHGSGLRADQPAECFEGLAAVRGDRRDAV